MSKNVGIFRIQRELVILKVIESNVQATWLLLCFFSSKPLVDSWCHFARFGAYLRNLAKEVA